MQAQPKDGLDLSKYKFIEEMRISQELPMAKEKMSFVSLCHRGIFFAFFRHFLHSLFSLLIHFPLCFMRLFSMIFLKSLWPILLFKIVLSYLIAPIRFHTLSLFSFLEHTLGRRRTTSILGERPQENYPQQETGEE